MWNEEEDPKAEEKKEKVSQRNKSLSKLWDRSVSKNSGGDWFQERSRSEQEGSGVPGGVYPCFALAIISLFALFLLSLAFWIYAGNLLHAASKEAIECASWEEWGGCDGVCGHKYRERKCNTMKSIEKTVCALANCWRNLTDLPWKDLEVGCVNVRDEANEERPLKHKLQYRDVSKEQRVRIDSLNAVRLFPCR